MEVLQYNSIFLIDQVVSDRTCLPRLVSSYKHD